MQTILKISPVLLLAACAFDDSALNLKTACRADSDCLSGVCLEGTCEDLGLDAADVDEDTTADAGTTIDISECDTPNECGGCQELSGSAGAACPDQCGVLECSVDGESLECNGAPSNPCGGCEPLEAPPGLACDECGLWECDGPDAVSCVGAGTNECGGCDPLTERLGEPCGTCGGDWMCDGTDSVSCVGADADPCGGCEGPFDVAIGDLCACSGTTGATWACEGESLECGDQTDSLVTADSLGTISDNSSTVLSTRGSFHTGSDADYYAIRVIDSDDLIDGLFPLVTVTDVPEDRRVCAFWLYDDRRVWNLQCGSGSVRTIFEGNQACCVTGGRESQIGVMQDIVAFARLDDILAPGTAGGVLYTAVEPLGESTQACEPYHLQFSF